MNCMTCELVARRDAGEAPLWDRIERTPYWDIVHNFATSLPGWLVLVTRRHVATVAELLPEESQELGELIPKVSRALQTAVSCKKTYVVQFAEHPDHPHVHFHIVPRPADLPADKRGPRIFAYSGVEEAERVREAQMNEIAHKVRELIA